MFQTIRILKKSLYFENTPMKITLDIDDELLTKAQQLTGIAEPTALVRKGLRALVERESAKRLARLGGAEPQLQPIPRRKSKSP